MPNHIANELEFNCSTSTFEKVLNFLKEEDGELGSVDFNKLIPMPASLDVEAGSRGEEGYKLYKEYLDEVRYVSSEEDRKAIYNSYLEKCGDDPEKLSMGKQYYENERDYGAKNWYDWRCENWGTKWNAYDCSEQSPEDKYLFFNTAWSSVPSIVQKISELFPDAGIKYSWADEDIGYNCGVLVFREGRVIGSDVPEGGTYHAYEIAARVQGYDLSEFENLPEPEPEQPKIKSRSEAR